LGEKWCALFAPKTRGNTFKPQKREHLCQFRAQLINIKRRVINRFSTDYAQAKLLSKG
jgi:hypothetical protein